MIWLLFACNPTSNKANSVSDFYGKNHQVTTYAVEDLCFDGAMTLLYMPEGQDVPQQFQYPVYVPTLEELPMTYEISFREPFIGMMVTATDAGGGNISLGEGQMEEVSLGSTFGECIATMDVEAEITPGVGQFDIVSIVTISDLRGDEQSCPVPRLNICQVSLYMESVPWD